MTDSYQALQPIIDAASRAPMRIKAFTDSAGRPVMMAFHEGGREYGICPIEQAGNRYVHGGTLFFSVDGSTVTPTAYTSNATGRIEPGDSRDGELVTKLADLAALAKQITL